jgi:hypothetical protein
MNALDFYLNVFRVAITHSVETAHVVVFSYVIIVGVVTRYVPAIRESIWERIGHYFPAADNIENWQVGLVILVFVILARLVAAPFWIWEAEHQNLIAATAKIFTLNAQLEDRERTRAIRRELGVFLEQGRQLMTVCADETKAPPSAEADAWATRVETFLNEQLDASFIARFRSGAGLPLTATSITSIPHRSLWSGIWVRTSRLQQFIQELSAGGN